MSAKAPLRAFHFVGVLLFAFLAVSSTTAGGEAEPYTLAVVPRFTALETHRDWAPFVARLSQDAGLPIRLRVYKAYSEFEDDLVRGVPEFVFLSPYRAVRARRAQGYVPLVCDSAKVLTGILVVRRDSPARSVRDLDGKDLAFPSPNAFGASLYIRALLTEKEKVRFTPRYVGSHANVYRHVILGKAAAGGGVNHTLSRELREVRDKLRVLYETPGSAPHPLIAHPRVPEAARRAVIDAVLRLGADESARDLLDAVHLSRPVPADYARDYQRLEQLNLERYMSHGP